MLTRNLTVRRTCALTAAVLLSSAFALLTGCGVATTDTSVSPNIIPSFTGHAFGGTQPISGATIKIYATGTTPGDGTSTNTGYGVGTLLAEATTVGSTGQDTDATGKFSFAGGYDCPAGQFAYLVSTGGDTGAGAVNPNAVLVAALGRCEDLYSSSGGVYTGYSGAKLDINELTTVAAAYALGHFASVSGSGASTVVSIGADATNNAAQVSGVSTGCIAGVGTCTTTAAAGLAHAFQNALNLASPFITGSDATANATLPGNSLAVVPQALINSLANVMVTCVNSQGGSATAGASDGTPCGNLFAATTVNGTSPTDTFSAYVNLAANPTLGGSTTACANFLNLATPTSQDYSPTLTSTTNLNDLSIAINYPSVAGNTAITYPQSGAVDINDVYYIGNPASSGNAPVNVLAYQSDGTYNGASATQSNMKNAFGLSLDALGHGYFANGSGSSSNELGVFSTSNGVPSTPTVWTSTANSLAMKPFYVAIDRANNIWLAGTTSALYKCTTAGTCASQASPTFVPPSSNYVGLAVDPDQNIWMTAATSLSVWPNTGTVAAPTYTGSLITATTTVNPATGITFVAGSSPAYTAYVSGYNTTTAGIQPFAPTLGGSNNVAVTAVTPGTNATPTEGANAASTGAYVNATDGNSVIWISDVNSHSVVQWVPGASTANRLIPCGYITSGACGSLGVMTSSGKPYTLSIDSAGSIWVTVPASKSVFEIIGSAAPTWPLLSLGLTGKP